jgi:hypothetical protein
MLMLLVNLPPAVAAVTAARVSRNGVGITADVVSGHVSGGEGSQSYWLEFRLPEEIDPDREVRPARVDRTTFVRAERTRELEVRVLEDRPSAYQVVGEVRSRAGWWVLLGLDALIVGGFWLSKRVRRRGPPEVVRLEALGPVVRSSDDPAVDAVCGVLVAASADDVLIDDGDQRYLVLLDGHPVQALVGQPAQVRARALE